MIIKTQQVYKDSKKQLIENLETKKRGKKWVKVLKVFQ